MSDVPKLDDFTARLVQIAAGKAEATVTEGDVAVVGEAAKSLDEGTLTGLRSMLAACSPEQPVAPVVEAAPVVVEYTREEMLVDSFLQLIERTRAAQDISDAAVAWLDKLAERVRSTKSYNSTDYKELMKFRYDMNIKESVTEGRVDDETQGRVGKWLKSGYQIVGQTPALRRGEIKDMKELEKWKTHFARGTSFHFSGGTLYALRKLAESIDESPNPELNALIALGKPTLLSYAVDLAGFEDDSGFSGWSIRDLAVYVYESGHVARDGRIVSKGGREESVNEKQHPEVDIRLRRSAETDEWIAAVYKRGKFDDDASYFTDDKADAIATMAVMRKEYGLSEGFAAELPCRIGVAYLDALAGYFKYSPTSHTDAQRRSALIRKMRRAFVAALVAKGSTQQDAEAQADALKKDYLASLHESKLGESVQEWIASKINASLIALGVNPDQWQTIEDAVYAAALAGKLGDGTPSDETAAQVQGMVAELAAVQAAPTPAPDASAAEPAAPESGEVEGDIAVEPDLSSEDGIDAELEKMSELDVEPDVKEDDVDPEALAAGIEVELEHTDDAEAAKRIALTHLGERPDYYEQLAKLEKSPVKLKKESLEKTAKAKLLSWLGMSQGRYEDLSDKDVQRQAWSQLDWLRNNGHPELTMADVLEKLGLPEDAVERAMVSSPDEHRKANDDEMILFHSANRQLGQRPVAGGYGYNSHQDARGRRIEALDPKTGHRADVSLQLDFDDAVELINKAGVVRSADLQLLHKLVGEMLNPAQRMRCTRKLRNMTDRWNAGVFESRGADVKQPTFVLKTDDGELVTVSVNDEAAQYNEVAKANLWDTIDANNKYFSLLSGDGYVGRATLTRAVYNKVLAGRRGQHEAFKTNDTVMVEYLGEHVQGTIVEANDKQANVSLEEGILVVIDLRNISKLDTDDEYINRVDAGEPIESIIEDMANADVIGGRVC
jgi:hypothetical protein